MNFLRNTFSILIGLFVSMIIITLGITLNSEWINQEWVVSRNYNPIIPFEKWQGVVKHASTWFFVALLISGGIASIIGGFVTALLVKEAKIAYSMFLGFILYLIGIVDNVTTPGHPTWYNIAIFFVLFPFAWLGGKIVDKYLNKKKVN